MLFLAFATLLSATSIETALMNQTAALDDWRTGLGFLTPEPVALLTAVPPGFDQDQGAETKAGQDELLVTATSPEALEALAIDHELEPISDVLAIVRSGEGLSLDDERIADLSPNPVATFSSFSQVGNHDPLRGQQWALDRLGVTDETLRGSDKQTIAIIDSGIWADHPDLAGQITESYYTGGGKVEHSAPVNDKCRLGHGTLVAGVTSAMANNGLGGRGIAPGARLIDIDAVDKAKCDKGPTIASTVAAIDLASQRQADVIVMSFGFRLGHCTLPLQQAIDRARARGATIVAAAGNTFQTPGRHLPESPASCDGVISVGATHRDGRPADYTTRNVWVDLAAPGGRTLQGQRYGTPDNYILTTNWPLAIGVPREHYTGVAGTSFAAPEVAATAALIRQIRPGAGPDEVEAILEHSASLGASPNPSLALGWGEIHLGQALNLASSPTPLPPKAFDMPYPVGLQSVRASMGRIQSVKRLADHDDPIQRAVAISEATFVTHGDDPFRDRRGQAQWAVLSRADVHADALSGASLTLGVAPLLYTTPTLAAPTAAELTRVLAPGATVYLLGGTQALPDGIEVAIKELGFTPIRIGGSNRIETSALIAKEVRDQVREAGIDTVSASMITSADAWADSIGAGYLGAASGIPVVLSEADVLSVSATKAIADDPYVFLVGGAKRLSPVLERELGKNREPGSVIRLAGPDRYHTMIRVAARVERLRATQQTTVSVLNFDDTYGWPTALAAAIPSAAFAQLPVAVSADRADRDVLTYIQGVGRPVTVWGPEAHVSSQVVQQVKLAVSTPYQLAGSS